jgi:hypothetical protein
MQGFSSQIRSQGNEKFIQKSTRAKLRGEAKPMATGKNKEDL